MNGGGESVSGEMMNYDMMSHEDPSLMGVMNDGTLEGGSGLYSEFEIINSVVGDGLDNGKNRGNGEIGISSLAFDTVEELLWIGTKSGHVTSYYGTHLQKYTSFKVHPRDQVRNILTMDDRLLILTNSTLRCQLRRGIPQFTHSSKNTVDMHSILHNSRNNRVLMSGMQDKLIELDLDRVREITTHDTGGSCVILREHSKYICCGDAPKGQINLRDPRSLKVVNTLDAHTGTLSDFDVHGHHLVTCGHSMRHNMEQPDRFLMVYDLRILRATNPIQSMVVPYQLRFLPSMTSRIAIMSATGQVQMADTACLSTPQISMFQINMPMEGINTISMDISPSNQCMAFGDTSNTVYLYSTVPDPVLNPYARSTEFADPLEQLPFISMEDESAIYSSVSRPHLPPGTTTYLSDYWPERFARQAYRPTPQIQSEILKNMKIVGSVGYARNVDNMKRNLVSYPNVRQASDSNGIGNGGHDGDKSHSKDDKKKCGDGDINPLIPKRYRKVVIKYSKMGLDEFDFDRYNRTGFCGLEATLPNSYSNSMLQILYYTEKLRRIILNHTCDRDSCLACELSFLFHMMDNSPGIPCQSSNFLRSLRTIPEASALGIILSSDEDGIKKTNVPRLIQSWNRFILQQISIQCDESSSQNKNYTWNNQHHHSPMRSIRSNNSNKLNLEDMTREIGAVIDPSDTNNVDDNDANSSKISHISKIFGIQQDKINNCLKCKTSVQTRDSIMVINLSYPELTDLKPMSFQDVVCSSMCPEQSTPAWCDSCRKYQTTMIRRVVAGLPHILNLNAGMDNPQDIAWWQTQMELFYRAHHKKEPITTTTTTNSELESCSSASTVGPTPITTTKPCRYGQSCNRRPDCKFWHPENDAKQNNDGSNPGQSSDDIGDKLYRENLSWVPMRMVLRRHKDGSVSSSSDIVTDDDDETIVERKIYELYGVCSNIVDSRTGESNNLVANINIGSFYHSRIASPVSQWYILNDFSITTINPAEATWFNLTWKIPCVFTYQSIGDDDAVTEEFKNIPEKNPITAEVFTQDRSLAQQRGGRKRITFIPLGTDEMPQKGDIVAIDAEFVTLNQEESELRSDGKVSLLKAAHMSVARITCVRGSGILEGAPFIDDYISTQEQVVDYVTKFSGIKPGDLDANFSSKHLTTLKSTYQKLRYLVDSGVIFIGHGLKNDFRVINLVVPAEQVIDTVHLFHLPHHRMVSLKFLAWFFLNRNIQGVTHDSIEDAVTALSLYKKYLQLKKEDGFITALNTLYAKGKELNWKIPSDNE